MPAPNRLRSLAALFFVVALAAVPGVGGEPHILAPADTSSPRATLTSFVTMVDGIYADLTGEAQSADLRDRLRRRIAKLGVCFDLSAVAPSLVGSKQRQTSVYLKEVFDRIGLPPSEEIPDAGVVNADSLKRWRVPDTDITLVRVAEGPRAGEWVFSTDTVARAESFFGLVRHLPYRADAGSPGLLALYLDSPGWMIPRHLILGLPEWCRQRFLDVSVWQWSAVAILLAIGGAVVAAAFALARRARVRPGLLALATTLSAPLLLIGTCLVLDTLYTDQVRITGNVLFVAKTALRIGIFCGCVVLVHAVLARLGEAVIRSRRLKPGTIDTQVVRLGFRILTVLSTAWMVIQGADSMGVSVTPLIAGLGVGGLAVALAAQHTIENFIAGLVLFADKPVRIGDTCQFGEHRGTVEQIGLRSTRIRGLDRTVISIPNSEFARLRLVNFARRDRILLKTMVCVRYETSADQLRHLLAALRQLLTKHPRIDAESVRVRFVGYGGYSLDIEIFALAETNDWATFLAIQEDILLEMMDVVAGSGCSFAFPSQTHYLASDNAADASVRQRAELQIRDLRATSGLATAGFLERDAGSESPPAETTTRPHRSAA